MTKDFREFDHPFENMNLDDAYCFLCGNRMGEDVTREDVLPRWLQRKHNLSSEKLTLVNGTHIKYSQLKIPCCSECNNEHLSRFENDISSAIKQGYSATLEIDPQMLFLWGAKIIYGIIRKNLSLPLDQSQPEKGSLLSKKFAKSYHDLHCFMQGIRRPMEFIGPLPFSVLVANLHDLGYGRDFGFRDSLVSQTLCIRSGEVGIIIALADAGFNDHTYSRYLQEVDGRKIHPIQFDELFAKVTYQSHRLVSSPYFTVSANKDKSVPIQVVPHLPSNPVIKDWDQREFADYLETAMEKWNLPIDSFFVPPDRVHTFLTSHDGSLKFIDKSID